MIATGPGIAVDSEFAALTSMVDLAPTIVDLALGSAAVPESMDGGSFASYLAPTLYIDDDDDDGGGDNNDDGDDSNLNNPSSNNAYASSNNGWKTVALVEYMSIRASDLLDACDLVAAVKSARTAEERRRAETDLANVVSAYGFTEVDSHGQPVLCSSDRGGTPNRHIHDGPNNTFAAIRVVDPAAGHDLLCVRYCCDVMVCLCWLRLCVLRRASASTRSAR